MAAGEDDPAIVQAIVAPARAMRLQSVAEGVEHAPQARVLRKIGVDFPQRYDFGKPVQADELSLPPVFAA